MNDELPTVYYPLSVLDSLMLEQKQCEDDVVALAVAGAVAEERAAVVAWLRERQEAAEWALTAAGYEHAADAIERGEHRREEER
jgi:hypothetical protein